MRIYQFTISNKQFTELTNSSKGEPYENWALGQKTTPLIEIKYKPFFYKGEPSALITDLSYPLYDESLKFSSEIDRYAAVKFKSYIKLLSRRSQREALIGLLKQTKLKYACLLDKYEDIGITLKMTPVEDKAKGLKYFVSTHEEWSSLQESAFWEYAQKTLPEYPKDNLETHDIKKIFKPLESTKSNRLVNQFYQKIGQAIVKKQDALDIAREIGEKGNAITIDKPNTDYNDYNIFNEKDYVASFTISSKMKEKMLNSAPTREFKVWAERYFGGRNHFGIDNQLGHIRYFPDIEIEGKHYLYIQEIQSDFHMDAMRFLNEVKNFKNKVTPKMIEDAVSFNIDTIEILKDYIEKDKAIPNDLSYYQMVNGEIKKRENVIGQSFFTNAPNKQKAVNDLIGIVRLNMSKVLYYQDVIEEMKGSGLTTGSVVKWFDEFVENWHFEALAELAKKAKQKGVEYIAITDTFHEDSNPREDSPVQYQRYYVNTAQKIGMIKSSNGEFWSSDIDVFISKASGLHEGLIVETNFYKQALAAIKDVDDKLSPKELKKALDLVKDSRLKKRLFDEVDNKTVLKKDLKDLIYSIGYKGNELSDPEEYPYGMSTLENIPQQSVIYKFSDKALNDMLSDMKAPNVWKNFIRKFAGVTFSGLHPRDSKYIGHIRYHTDYPYNGKRALWIQEIQSDLKNEVYKSYEEDDKSKFVDWIDSHLKNWYVFALESLLKRAKSEGYEYFTITKDFHEDSKPSQSAYETIYRSLAKKLDMKDAESEAKILNPEEVEDSEAAVKARRKYEIERDEKLKIINQKLKDVTIENVIEACKSHTPLREKFLSEYNQRFNEQVSDRGIGLYGFTDRGNSLRVEEIGLSTFNVEIEKFFRKDLSAKLYFEITNPFDIKAMPDRWNSFIKRKADDLRYGTAPDKSWYEVISGLIGDSWFTKWEREVESLDWHPDKTTPDDSEYEKWLRDNVDKLGLYGRYEGILKQKYSVQPYWNVSNEKWLPKAKFWVKELSNNTIQKLNSLHESKQVSATIYLR